MNRQHQKGLGTNRPRHMGLLERLVMWRVIAVQSRALIAEKPSTTDKKTANRQQEQGGQGRSGQHTAVRKIAVSTQRSAGRKKRSASSDQERHCFHASGMEGRVEQGPPLTLGEQSTE